MPFPLAYGVNASYDLAEMVISAIGISAIGISESGARICSHYDKVVSAWSQQTGQPLSLSSHVASLAEPCRE